jgi:hypothetical protein
MKSGSYYLLKGFTSNGALPITNLTAGTSYDFYVEYNSGRKYFTIVAGQDSAFIQTTKVAVNLKSCDGLITTGGNASVYVKGNASGNDLLLGFTSSGTRSVYLLPGSYDFRMDYKFGRNRKSGVQVSGTTKDVDFVATQVTLNASGITYKGVTNPSFFLFNDGSYLLPGTYTFKIEGFTSDITVSGCSTSPKTVMVRLINSSGTGIAGGVVDVWAINNSPAYSNNVAITNSSGNAIVFFPETVNDYVYFRMNYANSKQQLGHFNINTTTTVTFSTHAVTLRLLDSNSSPIQGGTADYFTNRYLAFGTTNASGNVVKELLPGSYYFRMRYNELSEQKGPLTVSSDLTINFTYTGSDIFSVDKQYTKKPAVLADYIGVIPELTTIEKEEIYQPDSKVASFISKLTAYPNPFTSSSTLSYKLNSNQYVQIDMYNTNGMKVQTLVQGNQPQGAHTTNLNALNLPEGMYLIRLFANGGISQIPVVLAK